MLFLKTLKKYWLKQSRILIWNKEPKISFVKRFCYYRWFPDGKLNIYENCILQYLKSSCNKAAIITVNNNSKIKKYSYQEIDQLVSILIIHLKSFRQKNLRIMIHSSATIESAVSMLACAKLGIHFCVLFKELEYEAINSRINIFKPNVFLSNGPKVKINKKIKVLNIKKILNSNYKKKKYNQTRKLNYFSSDRDLFTLFTSGSTGAPKGITHSSGGYLLYSKYTCQKQFGINCNSVVLTASDAGWINGHTYSLFGPLSVGATTILMETPMLLLNKNLLKKVLKEKVSILYLPVTLIRLMRTIYKNYIFKKHSIITLGSMGEPLAKSIGNWFSRAFNLKSRAIINTYYQTETGGIICSPKYTETAKISPHGSVGNVVNKYIKISSLKNSKKKEVKILYPWPGCMKKVLNGLDFYKKYWDQNKFFRMFDEATRKKSYIEIHGRIDDVINIRGHRIGSEEIESILLKNKNITECCSVAVPDYLEGFQIILFIVAKKNVDDDIKKILNSNFGSFALPKSIYYLDNLPKTRSGKILRRLLREILLNPNKKYYGDTSTMIDKKVVNEIKNKILNYKL